MFPIIMSMTFEDPKDESKFEDLVNNYWDKNEKRKKHWEVSNEKSIDDHYMYNSSFGLLIRYDTCICRFFRRK